jgi:hypothetical protein
MIAELKEQTRSVLTEVSKATTNFLPLVRLSDVSALPQPASVDIDALGKRVIDYRQKLGYEVAFYECGPETAIAYALVLVDETIRDLSAQNAPAARTKLQHFLKRYPRPTRDDQKLLWRYIGSTYLLCNRGRDEVVKRFPHAESLEKGGKKSEALREYQEMNRIYPNPVTVAKIKALEATSH